MNQLVIDQGVRDRFPSLSAFLLSVSNVAVQRTDAKLEEYKEQIFTAVRGRYDLESVPQVPIFRAYRDFFWRVGVDPTKIRPAAEALIRRILAGKSIPSVNTLVDAYNLASIDTGVALATFDSSKVSGPMTMRFAREGEKFLGIGMQEAMTLNGGEVVVSDEERLVAVYPYRDADYSKVTFETTDVILMICGVPRVDDSVLYEAGKIAVDYVMKFCSRKVSS